jgi:hypothetical protein
MEIFNGNAVSACPDWPGVLSFILAYIEDVFLIFL